MEKEERFRKLERAEVKEARELNKKCDFMGCSYHYEDGNLDAYEDHLKNCHRINYY